MREYWMEVDAALLAESSGLPLEEARAIVRADWAASEGGMAWTFVVPAGAERLAVAGDWVAEDQVVFRLEDGSDVKSPFGGEFVEAEGGRFRVVRRAS